MKHQNRKIIFIQDAILSFPNITQPRTRDNGNSVYQCDLIMESNHPGFILIKKEFTQMAADQWKDKAGAIIQHIERTAKLRCYGKGDEKVNSKTGEVYDGYTNNVYVALKSKKRPQIIKEDGSNVDINNDFEYQRESEKLYPGCRVNTAICIWLQDNDFGKAVRADLVGIQFNADGEKLGGDVISGNSIDISNLFSPIHNFHNEIPYGDEFANNLPPFLA